MIKYLGSKRAMLPHLSKLAKASGAKTALDLFTGTTRVAKELKTLGMQVTAVDTASYSEVFAKTWIELDSDLYDNSELDESIRRLNSIPGESGYFTKTFCEDSRFFQPKNGERVDSIRNLIESDYSSSWLYYPLLSSLILATDRVDSTTGQHMAYLKTWARRSLKDMELQNPGLVQGAGKAIRGDVSKVIMDLPTVEMAYLDPPYNQHRYFSNYHIWETLVRWDNPESYGIANKRIDCRDDSNKSDFNSKNTMANALGDLVENLNCEILMMSYNNESWLSRKQLLDMCEKHERVEIVDFDYKRYVGSQIGVYNKTGEKVGTPGARRNLEHVVLAGPSKTVSRMLDAL